MYAFSSKSGSEPFRALGDLTWNDPDVNNLCLIDKSMLLPDSFTYFSEAHGSTFLLDHCMTTGSGKSLISDISIENTFICSDHYPLCVNIACDISPISTTCLSRIKYVTLTSVNMNPAH